MVVDETELRRVHTYDLDGDTYQSVWDEHTASHALGDETCLGVVVGFEHTWNEKEYIMSGGPYELQSQAHYWCFRPRPDKYSYYDYLIMSLEECIDMFANGHGIFHDHVDALEIASNMDREQRNRFENANL